MAGLEAQLLDRIEVLEEREEMLSEFALAMVERGYGCCYSPRRTNCHVPLCLQPEMGRGLS